MDYRNLILNGRSVRDFKDEKVDEKKLNEIRGYIVACKKLIPTLDVGVEFFTKEQAFDKLQGVAGYKGFMIEAPTYMVVLSEEADQDIENAGYVGERAILKARDLGIDSCWITFESSDEIKSRLGINSDKKVLGLIALGYPSTTGKTIKHATKVGENYSKSNVEIVNNEGTRKALEEIIFIDKWGNNIDVQTLEERGLFDAFSVARMAPSSLNKQPWRFIIDGGRVILCIDNKNYKEDYANRVDAGIIMLYFGIILDITMFDSRWGFDEVDKAAYSIPDEYHVVGYCNI